MAATAAGGKQLSPEEVARALTALPPLPAVALRVMQVAQDPKSSAAELALAVSSDPGLSSTILRIINSAAYRRAREVTSVQEALVMLGFVQARNIAISGAIAGAYAPDAANALFRINAFWRHSIAVAFKASELATQSKRVDPPSAFTAGVLHNMGRLAMFYADPAGLDQAVAQAMSRDLPIETIEGELLGYDHTRLGQMLAERWKIPADIRIAIMTHHEDSPSSPLAAIIAQADRFCVSHGILPGYAVPPAGRTIDLDFGRLARQVDTLMELINGTPIGVRAAK